MYFYDNYILYLHQFISYLFSGNASVKHLIATAEMTPLDELVFLKVENNYM